MIIAPVEEPCKERLNNLGNNSERSLWKTDKCNPAVVNATWAMRIVVLDALIWEPLLLHQEIR